MPLSKITSEISSEDYSKIINLLLTKCWDLPQAVNSVYSYLVDKEDSNDLINQINGLGYEVETNDIGLLVEFLIPEVDVFIKYSSKALEAFPFSFTTFNPENYFNDFKL